MWVIATQTLGWTPLASGRTKLRSVSLVLALGVSLAAAGCACPRTDLLVCNGPVAEAEVIFVADGAGNFQCASSHLREVVCACKLPLEVATFEWSHGHYRIIADQVDYPHSRAEGRRLANSILRFRADHPGVPVHLVGHSAGSMVILCALEELPERSIERVVLLGPAVSADYDLVQALRAVNGSMHNFYSRGDHFYLGFAVGILGTSDRCWGASAGRHGFRLPPLSPDTDRQYAKLSQRAWQPRDSALGNFGGHYGCYQPEFLKVHVLPLFR